MDSSPASTTHPQPSPKMPVNTKSHVFSVVTSDQRWTPPHQHQPPTHNPPQRCQLTQNLTFFLWWHLIKDGPLLTSINHPPTTLPKDASLHKISRFFCGDIWSKMDPSSPASTTHPQPSPKMPVNTKSHVFSVVTSDQRWTPPHQHQPPTHNPPQRCQLT